MTVTSGTRKVATPAAGRRIDGWYPWISTVARFGLAVVWAWAGSAKISNPDVAAQAVRAYQILPESLVKPVGYGLPFLELALALLLVLGIGTRYVAAISGFMFLCVFIPGIASVWARGLTINCGCFGGGGAVSKAQTQYLQEILRDIGFLIIAVYLVWKPRSKASLDGVLAADPAR